MNTFEKIGMSIIVVSTLALSGCGGSGSSSSGGGSTTTGGGNGGVTSNSAIESQNIVPYTVTTTNSIAGKIYVSKYGVTGKLVANKKTYGQHEWMEMKFKSGVTSLTIVAATSHNIYDVTINGEHYTGTNDIDYKKGTEHIVGDSSKHGHVECTNTYQATLPEVWQDEASIEMPYLDTAALSSTDCPDWVNDDSDSNNEPTSMSVLSNYTLTDSDGDVTKYSEYSKI